MSPRLGLALVLLNVALAAAMAALAPASVGTTGDRVGYEWVAQNGLAPNCPHSIYCYRVLVPSLLAHVPLPEVAAWRSFAAVANAATGVLLSILTSAAITRLPRPAGAVDRVRWTAPVVASVLFQTSFGATFALFDPFTPDAAVFLFAAALTLAWWFDRPVLAVPLVVLGVFAKETVALVALALAAAAWFDGRRRAWLIPAIASALVGLGFHAAMDGFAGWTERGSVSADLLGGSWLARWLADSTLTSSSRLLYLFIPFGFAWLYAALGLRDAPPRLRALAATSAPLLLILVYVQTPERALGTGNYAVIPLAAIYLGRAPAPIALAAAITNGLLTARVGLSTSWLPPEPYLLILAGTAAAVAIVRERMVSRASSTVLIGSSRITSSR